MDDEGEIVEEDDEEEETSSDLILLWLRSTTDNLGKTEFDSRRKEADTRELWLARSISKEGNEVLEVDVEDVYRDEIDDN